jgi:hypothetical protein
MGFRATLETDTAERLCLWLPDGRLGGKALLTFITALHTWCDNDADAELQEWFATLEQSGPASLCTLTSPLLTAWYSGFWDFQPDDYPIYQLRYPDDPLTEAEFKQNLASITQR